MAKEIRIEEQGEELQISFWVDGNKTPFDDLGDEDKGSFCQMIRCFSHYFIDMEAMANTQIFNPN